MSAAIYVIDPGMSRFAVRGVAAGMLSGLGHNPVIGIRDFNGEVRFDPQSPGQSTLRMVIHAASLEVQNNASEKDRREMKRVMDEEVLEIDSYPDIVFETTGVKTGGEGGDNFRAEVEGKLTLHGVTRPFRVPVKVSAAGDTVRGNGEFSLLQTDYGMKPPSVAGGALKLKDELKLSFDVMARIKAGGALRAGG